MRILLVNNFFCKLGGTENYLINLAGLLKSHGHEVFFFATDKKQYLNKDYQFTNYFPRFIDYAFLSKIQQIKHAYKLLYNVEAGKKLNEFISKIEPDIIHFNNIGYYLTSSVINSAYNNNIPIVMTLHDTRLMCPCGSLMLKDSEYCKKELCIRGNSIHCLINRCKYKSLKASLIASTENFFARINNIQGKVSHFICPSQAILNLAEKSGIDKDKLTVINTFINKDIPDNNFKNQGYFLYIGRLSKEKGLYYLLDAMKQLPQIKLKIIGSGPEKENLKKHAQDAINIEFLGFVADDELNKYYNDCIATILPCNWFENCPATVIESFYYGKAVIASNIGGIPEMVENGKQGITFEPGNTTELVNAIKHLYMNKNLAIEMGKNAREKAINTYTSQIYYKGLNRVYSKVIQKYVNELFKQILVT